MRHGETPRQGEAALSKKKATRGENNDAMPVSHCASLEEAVAMLAGEQLLFEPGTQYRSNSLWTAVLYHGVHNVAIQGIFDGSTIDTGATRWITTEFGFGLAGVSVLIAMYFWSRRAELTSEARASEMRSAGQGDMTLDSNAGPDRQPRLADSPESGPVEGETSRCPNCSAELEFEYCPRCGQRRIHPEDLSARHYFRELANELATLHERFKTLRTLYKLLVPGLLSAEFLAGRRQPYLTPFKVYVVSAPVFFLAAPTAGFSLASLIEADQSGTLSRLVSAREADRGLAPPLFNARFDVRVQSVYTITLGAAAVVFALLLQWLFRKQRRRTART